MMTAWMIATLMALGEPAPAAPQSARIERIGKIEETRRELADTSAARLVADDGTSLKLTGADPGLSEELARLAGVRVEVVGTVDETSGLLRVVKYTIVDVGRGVVPRIGRLATLDLADRGGPRLIFVDEDGHAELLPRGWSTKMMRHAGAKLWMVGKKSENGFTPLRFSILRSKAAATPPPSSDTD